MGERSQEPEPVPADKSHLRGLPSLVQSPGQSSHEQHGTCGAEDGDSESQPLLLRPYGRPRQRTKHVINNFLLYTLHNISTIS
jgi:hypothetical protein